MKNVNLISKIGILSLVLLTFVSYTNTSRKTIVTIKGNQFYINGELTYKHRYWKRNKIEGLLLNSRMVQGIFDDINPKTKDNFVYPDTQKWDADRNTNEFVKNMDDWYLHGLIAFTLNLQGGSPMGYGVHEGMINSTFDEKGDLSPKYIDRLERILDKADELGMVVILGYFYFGQDQYLEDETAVIHAVENITKWIIDKGYKNILIEINNECNILYDHKILQPQRVNELIEKVQKMSKNGFPLLVSTSFTGGRVPASNVVKSADFILLHGNGLKEPSQITILIDSTKKVEGYHSQPIVFNEDDHFNFESDTCNFITAIKSYASWGYFDYRMKGEGFECGFQSIPVDWGIHSERKIKFFNKLKEITGK
jgi:hypothetical protein